MELMSMLLFFMSSAKIVQNRPQALGKSLQFSCSNFSCMVVGADREFGTCLNMQAVSNGGVIEKPKRTKKVRVEFPKWTEHLFLDLISFSLTLAASTSLHGLPGWQTFGTGLGHKVLLQSNCNRSNSILKCVHYI